MQSQDSPATNAGNGRTATKPVRRADLGPRFGTALDRPTLAKNAQTRTALRTAYARPVHARALQQSPQRHQRDTAATASMDAGDQEGDSRWSVLRRKSMTNCASAATASVQLDHRYEHLRRWGDSPCRSCCRRLTLFLCIELCWRRKTVFCMGLALASRNLGLAPQTTATAHLTLLQAAWLQNETAPGTRWPSPDN